MSDGYDRACEYCGEWRFCRFVTDPLGTTNSTAPLMRWLCARCFEARQREARDMTTDWQWPGVSGD